MLSPQEGNFCCSILNPFRLLFNLVIAFSLRRRYLCFIHVYIYLVGARNARIQWTKWQLVKNKYALENENRQRIFAVVVVVVGRLWFHARDYRDKIIASQLDSTPTTQKSIRLLSLQIEITIYQLRSTIAFNMVASSQSCCERLSHRHRVLYSALSLAGCRSQPTYHFHIAMT